MALHLTIHLAQPPLIVILELDLRFNNANLTSATTLFIDDQDDNATDIQTYLRTIDDSTSAIKGHFRISNKLNADDFAIFTIDGAITEATGYFKVPCSRISGSATSFSNSEDVIITFARTGDKVIRVFKVLKVSKVTKVQGYKDLRVSKECSGTSRSQTQGNSRCSGTPGTSGQPRSARCSR